MTLIEPTRDDCMGGCNTLKNKMHQFGQDAYRIIP